ncbi:MAG: hypothetical protein ABII01_01960 [Candidatus Woesearchaeota archaeon]
MGCFLIPTAAMIFHFLLGKNNEKIGKYRHSSTLSYLFLGGAIFGIVDHWFNGELFLLSSNLIEDMILGITITLVILIIWSSIVVYDMIVHDISKDKRMMNI